MGLKTTVRCTVILARTCLLHKLKVPTEMEGKVGRGGGPKRSLETEEGRRSPHTPRDHPLIVGCITLYDFGLATRFTCVSWPFDSTSTCFPSSTLLRPPFLTSFILLPRFWPWSLRSGPFLPPSTSPLGLLQLTFWCSRYSLRNWLSSLRRPSSNGQPPLSPSRFDRDVTEVY